MNHRIKTNLFKLLDRLPDRIGSASYHFIQRIYNKHTVPFMVEDHLNTLTRFNEGLSKHNLSFNGKTIVEIGSGWLPVTPYHLISTFNASSVLTFDINHHYQNGKIKILNALFNQRTEGKFPGKEDGLPPSISYYPNTDILKSPPKMADVILTRNVLEHVPPEIIFSMHTGALKYLNSGGVIIHQISPSDHRAYSDRSLSLWDFLKYSQNDWNKIQTRFDYHNRMRLPQYLDVFAKAGLDVIHCDYNFKTDTSKLPPVLDEEFRNFSVKELTAGNIFVILKKKPE